MIINVPIELDTEMINNAIQALLDQQNNQVQTNDATDELPPYPTRKQVKKILHIGDERLNDWINHGLHVIPFGKETRFDREDIKSFLDRLKV